MNDKNPHFNGEGYRDPTAYEALNPIMKEDAALEALVHNLIKTLKSVISLAGFDVIGRIQVKHRKTGKEYR